nr:MAG TPA: hypothetical protein [Inoviridae sp.]
MKRGRPCNTPTKKRNLASCFGSSCACWPVLASRA